MAADVPTLKEGNFHTQIISLKEGPVRTGDSALTEERNVMLREKAQREDLFFNWFILVCNANQTGSAVSGTAFLFIFCRFQQFNFPAKIKNSLNNPIIHL
jgi:hypothetical protein